MIFYILTKNYAQVVIHKQIHREKTTLMNENHLNIHPALKQRNSDKTKQADV